MTAQEWNDIAMDFIFNEMYDEAEKSYKRGIALGSYRSMAWLGSLYEKLNRLEEAYQCYLEAAMAKGRIRCSTHLPPSPRYGTWNIR